VPALRACLLNCTLKPAGETSSTDVLLDEVAAELRACGVEAGEAVRVVSLDVRPGVTSDEGPGDAWPALRQQVLDAELLVLGTPIWLGHPSSVAQRVLERLDAFLGETDEQGRMVSSGRVAIVAVVGNEDGAHHVAAELYQGLVDVGFTIPASGMTYWVGRAMEGVDYQDLEERPEAVASATKLAVANAVHLAGLLAGAGYPAVS
jgi:multimeric flavodoxin WrbA